MTTFYNLSAEAIGRADLAVASTENPRIVQRIAELLQKRDAMACNATEKATPSGSARRGWQEMAGSRPGCP